MPLRRGVPPRSGPGRAGAATAVLRRQAASRAKTSTLREVFHLLDQGERLLSTAGVKEQGNNLCSRD